MRVTIADAVDLIYVTLEPDDAEPVPLQVRHAR
jgi:hypothetical protein